MTKFSKLATLALAGIVSLALTSGVFAEEAKKEAAAPAKATAKPAAKAKSMWATGKVTAVDAAASTITIEKKGKKGMESETFTVGKDVKIADIKKDSKVTVTYTKEGDKMEASKVAEVKATSSAHKHETKKEEKAEKAETK